ncbi:hypothetical protein CRG98_023687 [Punica granatum]|uniref:Reverse transcriptase zinc-binding domain-containing protein n=1 Tax=Punica granatum TaxID=22663 RepID=A0A2I0JI80_PUNGR|nr:hypothetical protein CRG98_023687 [Punica granatum]
MHGKGRNLDFYFLAAGVWRVIWSWEGPQRLRAFLWLVACDNLLTNEARVRQRLTVSADCPRCNTNVESIIHILRDCSSARQMWERLIPPSLQPNFFSVSLHDWLMLNLVWPPCENWPTIFVTGCWLLWTWRNKELFCTDFDRPRDEGRTILAAARSFREGRLLSSQAVDGSKSKWISIYWVKPPEDFMKLNTDGVVRGSQGVTGAGGILRNSSGGWIIGFMQSLGVSTVTVAEL